MTEHRERQARANRGPRLALHYKVMASYAVVIGLVIFPTMFYVQTVLRTEMRELRDAELDREVGILAERLGRAPAEELRSMVQLVLATMPNRVTILDANGQVIGDNTAAAASPNGGESRADRPEIKDALSTGEGRAERFSESTREHRLYVARRFPPEGPPRGVVRLSRGTLEIDRAVAETSNFFKKVGAVAMSAGLLLSLLAAFLVSAPLRRLSDAARAYASGDFGFDVKVTSNDELGDLAQALRELSAQLRETLVESGSDRASLRALLDELPVGVILYSGQSPIAISARAREIASLSASDEIEHAGALIEVPEHVEILRTVESTHRAVKRPIELPWAPRRKLMATWIGLFGPDGKSRVALVLEEHHVDRLDALGSATRALLHAARAALKAIANNELRAQIERVADDVERALPREAPSPSSLTPTPLDALCTTALDAVSGRAAARAIHVRLALPEDHVSVVEDSGRTTQAVRDLLAQAIKDAGDGARLVLRAEMNGATVKLSVRTPGKRVEVERISELISGLGGIAGSERQGDETETWIKIPRA